MNKEDLQRAYQNGELERTARLQNLRDDIRRITGLRVPRGAADVEEWWSNNKSVLARKLGSDDDEEEDSESGSE